ncbi:MAG TPA: S1C family serine protease [Acidimicrobiia bacterium]|nr:S1C family serine protease [Acidimicrobiia bacterium]
MRADGRDRWPGSSESGVGHVAAMVLVLVAAVVAFVTIRDSLPSLSNSPGAGTRSPAAATAAGRTVGPAVADLEVSLAGGGHRSATGLVLTPAGEVVTNNHVIAGATGITARPGGTGPAYTATVLGYDVTHDVAVLGLTGASGLSTIEPGSSSSVTTGDPVAVIGNVAGLEGAARARTGGVTGVHQQVAGGGERLSGLLEIHVATGARDSGGPVTGAGTKVLAMTTSAPGGGHFDGQSSDDVTYAIPIDDVLAVVDRVDAGHSTPSVHVGPRAALGVAVQPTSHGDTGAYVVGVTADGPAAKVGLVPDTIIVSIDNATIRTPGALDATLDRHRPGDRVGVGWVGHDGTYHVTDVELGTAPPR